MNRYFSIYLDAVRFLMAFMVFFYHSAFPNFLPWLPWLNVGHHAVIVFFVLSGMVIAWVAEDKENRCDTYLIARISRIYSVFLPTLLITFIALYVGAALNPAIYASVAIPRTVGEFLFALVGNLLLLNQHWGSHVSNLGNVPLWSLCYEFWYYLIFAAYSFARSRVQGLLLALLLVVACGPRIAFLLPLWVAGVVLHRHALRWRVSEPLGWLLFVLPVLFYALSYFLSFADSLHNMTLTTFGPRLRELGFSQHFVFDYLLGLGVAAHFIGANRIAFRLAPVLVRWEQPIRYLASFTFTFYLLHYPLLSLFAALPGHDPHSVPRGLLLWLLTLATILMVGRVTEQWRYSGRDILRGWFPASSTDTRGKPMV